MNKDFWTIVGIVVFMFIIVFWFIEANKKPASTPAKFIVEEEPAPIVVEQVKTNFPNKGK